MEVNTRVLSQASNELRQCSANINRTLDEVERIRHQLRELSNVDEFRWVLMRNEQSIRSAQRTVSNMASVLEDISEKYERTENKLCGRELMKNRRPQWLGGGYLPYAFVPAFVDLRRIGVIRKTLTILTYINKMK
ncbi:MAG: hypothetical protein IJE48_09660 [Clostridia bacterium]|nr:hypothetical protein [Clostridia bacterium]